MAILLPQSTAYTFRLGPFLDSTDGNAQENALTIAYTDVLLSKAGGALTAKAETTNLTGTGANAHYTCILGTGDTGTLGSLRVWCHVTGALCVYQDFLIVHALVYNSLVAGSDNLQVDTIQVAGTAQTAGDLATMITAVDDLVDTEVAAIKSDTAAILTDTGTTLDTKLNDIQGATFSSATDSLEAIRDRGDAAWTTGAGGSDRLLMVDTTIATLASQTSFTQVWR